MKKLLIFCTLLLNTLSNHASAYSIYTATIIAPYSITNYDQDIATIYTTVLQQNLSLSERITKASQYFLAKPYIGGALGEGPQGKFDQQPLYRTDGFDCETFVDTVLALAKAANTTEFKKTINQIRYKAGYVNYFNRNHFTSIDWNKNNEQEGYTKDITPEFKGYKILTTLIDKPHWYLHHTTTTLQLLKPINTVEAQQLLTQMHTHAKKTQAQLSQLTYIPLNILFNNGTPDEKIFNKIPSGAIIEIVTKKDFKQLIGTDLDISHMGLAIRTDKGLMFREASSIAHKVIDIPLIHYLLPYYSKPNKHGIIGIHVEQVLSH